MDDWTTLAAPVMEADRAIEDKPARRKLLPRPGARRVTVREVVDDVHKRFPVTMARLAE